MNVWRLIQGQRQVQGPGQGPEWELPPAEPAERESDLEMRLESKPGAELPSVPSELQEGEAKRRQVLNCAIFTNMCKTTRIKQ